jgi:hypothetical protein
MQDLRDGEPVWRLVKPAAGLVVLGVLAFVGVGLFMGIAGALLSFAAWASIRVLPILAVGALVYWLARETGFLDRLRR